MPEGFILERLKGKCAEVRAINVGMRIRRCSRCVFFSQTFLFGSRTKVVFERFFAILACLCSLEWLKRARIGVFFRNEFIVQVWFRLGIRGKLNDDKSIDLSFSVVISDDGS